MSVEQPRGMDFSGTPEEEEPMLLLAVNAEESVSWKEIEQRVRFSSMTLLPLSGLSEQRNTGKTTRAIPRAIDQRPS